MPGHKTLQFAGSLGEPINWVNLMKPSPTLVTIEKIGRVVDAETIVAGWSGSLLANSRRMGSAGSRSTES